MKKFLIIIAIVFSTTNLQNCDFIEQWIQWSYQGYNYNVPMGNPSWNWWNQGWNNNVSIRIQSQYFNGTLLIPLPQGIINPQFFGHSFNPNSNQGYLNFYDQNRNQLCGTSYTWRNNNPNTLYFGDYHY